MIFFHLPTQNIQGKGSANNFDGFILVCNDCPEMSVEILVKDTTFT